MVTWKCQQHSPVCSLHQLKSKLKKNIFRSHDLSTYQFCLFFLFFFFLHSIILGYSKALIQCQIKKQPRIEFFSFQEESLKELDHYVEDGQSCLDAVYYITLFGVPLQNRTHSLNTNMTTMIYLCSSMQIGWLRNNYSLLLDVPSSFFGIYREFRWDFLMQMESHFSQMLNFSQQSRAMVTFISHVKSDSKTSSSYSNIALILCLQQKIYRFNSNQILNRISQ